MGQQITWIQPYKFNQRLPFDVDYKVMGTFVEFYMALLKFTNYKLFSDLGLPYPVTEYPVSGGVETGENLEISKVREMQTSVRKLFEENEGNQEDEIVDKAFHNTPEMQQLKKR